MTRCCKKVRLPAAAEARGGVKQDSRSALLQAALECFSSRGFDGASIRDISQKAGLNSSLISHHFGSKEGLYIELFRHICRQKDAGLDAQEDTWPAPQDRAQAIQQLREQIRRLYQSFDTLPKNANPSHAMEKILMAQELRDPRPQVLAILRERMMPWFTRTGECIRLLKPEMSEAQRAFLAITIMGQVMSHHMMRGFSQACLNTTPLSMETAVDLLTEFNLNGLRGNKC